MVLRIRERCTLRRVIIISTIVKDLLVTALSMSETLARALRLNEQTLFFMVGAELHCSDSIPTLPFTLAGSKGSFWAYQFFVAR